MACGYRHRERPDGGDERETDGPDESSPHGRETDGGVPVSAIVTAFLAGAAIGVRHSFEADHVAAVATLVNDRTEAPGVVGAAWGVGHAIPVLLAGILFLALGTAIPDVVAHLFEPLAGAILVALGVRTVIGIRSSHPDGSRENGVRKRDDGEDHDHHDHHGHRGNRDRSEHDHLSVGPFSIGLFHSHRESESLAVGLVHGLAGTGALVAVLAATAPTVRASAAFLTAFAIASVLTMACLALIWGRLLGTNARYVLRAAAGVGSIVLGALLVSGELIGFGVA